MRKILLYLLTTVVLGFITPGSLTALHAQTFSRFRDTVGCNFTGTSPIMVNDDIVVPSGWVVLKWKVVSCNFPSDWLATNPGMCDNHICLSFAGTNGLWPAGFLAISDTYKVVGGSHDFHLSINLSSASVTTRGTYYVTAKLYNATNPDDSLYSTFAIANYPASVPLVGKITNEVSLYPNPTTNDINVVYDAVSDIKTIAVYSIIGKVMAVYKPVADNSANLSLGNVPAGIYFVRLMNSQGEVVATRKFSKQ